MVSIICAAVWWSASLTFSLGPGSTSPPPPILMPDSLSSSFQNQIRVWTHTFIFQNWEIIHCLITESVSYIRGVETFMISKHSSYVYYVSENYSRFKRSHPLCWTILLRLMTRQEQAPELLSSFLKFHGSKIQEDFSKSANSIGPIQINPQQCLCLKLECNEKILYLLPFPNPWRSRTRRFWSGRNAAAASPLLG